MLYLKGRRDIEAAPNIKVVMLHVFVFNDSDIRTVEGDLREKKKKNNGGGGFHPGWDPKPGITLVDGEGLEATDDWGWIGVGLKEGRRGATFGLGFSAWAKYIRRDGDLNKGSEVEVVSWRKELVHGIEKGKLNNIVYPAVARLKVEDREGFLISTARPRIGDGTPSIVFGWEGYRG